MPDKVIAEAENQAPGTQHYHYILNEDGSEAQDPIPVEGTTTYVTFKSDTLPLVRPLLLLPGGEIIAKTVEPTLTILVNAGYEDNQPIPNDPTVPRPMEPGSSVSDIITASGSLPGAVQQGVRDGVAAAKDLTNPGNLVTGPLNELKKTAGGLTNSSPVPVATTNSLKPSTSAFDMNTGGKFSAGGNSNNSSSPGGSKGPVRQVVGPHQFGAQ